jgi:CubicO group peptidase (beta-lactamase class C family)
MKEPLHAYVLNCIKEKIFPGCVVGILTKGRQEIIAAGSLTYDASSQKVDENTIYDVASITKAVPTSCLALKLIEEGRIELQSRLIDFVPEFSGTFRDQIRIEHLLTHTLDFDFRLSDKKNLPAREILDSIFKARLRMPPGTTFCYANATSILLGLAVERAGGMGLATAARMHLFGPLGMERTTFFPETIDRGSIAPTEDDPWRGRIIRGEVHDESAWALRPLMVAGSAGLFSTVSDLLRFLAVIINKGESGGRRIFRPETVRRMHTNALRPEFGAGTALGWELDRPDFMGTCRTASTFGKTGFTGCAIVGDPSRTTGFVFLANHTFPRRRENRSAINRVRSAVADIVFNDVTSAVTL